MDFTGQVLGDARDQGDFPVLRHAQGDYSGTQLLTQAVHELPKSFTVNILHFGGNKLNPFNNLHAPREFVDLAERPFALLRFQLLFELLGGLGELLDLGKDAVFTHVELAGQLAQDVRLLLKMLQSADAGHGFDAANAGGYGFLAHDFQHADVADALNVRPAAKFLGVEAAGGTRIGDGHHAHVMLGILVPEKRQRAGGQRLFERSHVRLDLCVQANLVVHLLLDVAQLFRIDVREMRKVKAQAVGSIQRAGLLHVRAENIPQRRVHKMRSSVIANDARAAVGLSNNRNAVGPADRFFRHNLVRHEARDGVKCALHFGEQLRFRVVVERAGVRHLPARLRINRRAVKHDFTALARFQFIDWTVFGDDGFYPTISRRRPMIEVQFRGEAVDRKST